MRGYLVRHLLAMLEHRLGEIAERELVPQPEGTMGSTMSLSRGYDPGQPETS